MYVRILYLYTRTHTHTLDIFESLLVYGVYAQHALSYLGLGLLCGLLFFSLFVRLFAYVDFSFDLLLSTHMCIVRRRTTLIAGLYA